MLQATPKMQTLWNLQMMEGTTEGITEINGEKWDEAEQAGKEDDAKDDDLENRRYAHGRKVDGPCESSFREYDMSCRHWLRHVGDGSGVQEYYSDCRMGLIEEALRKGFWMDTLDLSSLCGEMTEYYTLISFFGSVERLRGKA